mgnify:CR=1 FL=1
MIDRTIDDILDKLADVTAALGALTETRVLDRAIWNEKRAELLKAYEAAAIEQAIAEHVRNPVRIYATLNDFESDMAAIRRMLANYIANQVVPYRADWNGRLVTDYDFNNAYQYVINREDVHLTWLHDAVKDHGGTPEDAAALIKRDTVDMKELIDAGVFTIE